MGERSAAQDVPQKPPPLPKYLTTAEAAHYVRLSARSLERYRVDGTGPRYLKAGPGKRARVFYRPADLDAWLEDRTLLSTSEYGV
ncbi:MAG: helix-turn-helix domain-containing protein [Pseudomonadota bacterium]